MSRSSLPEVCGFLNSLVSYLLILILDIPQPKTILETKRNSIARFIHVLRPLSEIYKLPLRSIHIFYDSSGGTIAFNRNASLFMNLRYYEGWRKYFKPV